MGSEVLARDRQRVRPRHRHRPARCGGRPLPGNASAGHSRSVSCRCPV